MLLHRVGEFISSSAFTIESGNSAQKERAFTELALAVFHYQFEHNLPYRKLCQNRGVEPDHVRRWQEIPPVMASSFKYAPLFCGDHSQDAIRVFHTSGTTQNKPGKHYFRTLELYRTASLRMFKWACLPDSQKMSMLILGPNAVDFPNSSLGQMFSWVVEAYGAPDFSFCFSQKGLDFHSAMRWLQEQCLQQTPVFILATSLTLLDFIKNSHPGELPFKLPTGSRILDTGGYKSSLHSIERNDFLELAANQFGLPKEWIFNEYGMTELSSQFYETRFIAEAFGVGVKAMPPWVHSLACNPETLAPLPEGDEGVLRHFDLANLDSVAMLQTEDMGIVRGCTIELLGRDPNAEPRGCSLLADEISRS